jgi:hypothetical protein
MTPPIMARFNYRAEFKLRKGMKFKPVFLDDFQAIEITHISSANAPVAYHVFSGDPLHKPFAVRLHGGQLWWPLRGDHGALQAQRFVECAKNDWARASAVLDPTGRTYAHFGTTFKERFPDGVAAFEVGDREKQVQQVQQDAARLAFLDGVVHVQAGDPVWYAVFNRATRWGFDMVIGPSSLDRKDRQGCQMDCADRGVRLTSARHGRAFGLNELQAGLRRLAPDTAHMVSKVVPTGLHEAGPADEVCAIAWAQHLWEVAWRYPHLRQLMPALADAKSDRPPPSCLPYLEMLETFVASEGTEAEQGLPPSFAEAHLLLERIARSKHVHDDEDEAALAFFAKSA